MQKPTKPFHKHFLSLTHCTMEITNADSLAAAPAPLENHNKAIVNTLYKGLASGDTATVAGLIATDLEWWFHGPQNCHHMMKMLTGKCSTTEFKFEPRSIDSIDECVIVEGWEGAQVYWVHVWTLKDGFITQFREYFNTWLTVKDLRPSRCSSSTTLWQSHPRDLTKRLLPGLMFAI
ncbi:wound-induced protein 1-like [Olea europaea var. sylvestris]|uniref:wound-induced protein 1-like n=1 Tax=Olea europaea var. sylvestris TaxID=158386 RepID=UPI000C1D2FF4|nr:wound-induced protein 1-like [Olea europaea var. sylvestris]